MFPSLADEKDKYKWHTLNISFQVEYIRCLGIMTLLHGHLKCDDRLTNNHESIVCWVTSTSRDEVLLVWKLKVVSVLEMMTLTLSYSKWVWYTGIAAAKFEGASFTLPAFDVCQRDVKVIFTARSEYRVSTSVRKLYWWLSTWIQTRDNQYQTAKCKSMNLCLNLCKKVETTAVNRMLTCGQHYVRYKLSKR